MGGEVILTGSQLLYVVVGSIVAGGGLTALGASSLYFVVRQILNNPSLVASMEAAAKNVDPEATVKIVNAAKVVRVVSEGVEAVGELVEEVFDNIPYADKSKIPQ